MLTCVNRVPDPENRGALAGPFVCQMVASPVRLILIGSWSFGM